MRGLLRNTRRAEVLGKLVFVSAVVALSVLAATMRVLVLRRLTVSKRLGGPFVPSQGRRRRACKLHQAGRAALHKGGDFICSDDLEDPGVLFDGRGGISPPPPPWATRCAGGALHIPDPLYVAGSGFAGYLQD